MGSGKMGLSFIAKTLLTRKSINEKIPHKIIPANGIFDIPTFQYSIIPCARQYPTASKLLLISISCRNSDISRLALLVFPSDPSYLCEFSDLTK